MDLKPNAASYSRAAHLRWVRGDVAGAERIMREAIDSTAPGRQSEPRAWVLERRGDDLLASRRLRRRRRGVRPRARVHGRLPAGARGQGARSSRQRATAAGAASLLERAYAKSPLVETAWLLGDARALARRRRAGARRPMTSSSATGAASTRARSRSSSRPRGATPPKRSTSPSESERPATTRTPKTRTPGPSTGAVASPSARRASDAATRWGTPDARLIYHAGAIRVAQGDVAGRSPARRASARAQPEDSTSRRSRRLERLLGRHRWLALSRAARGSRSPPVSRDRRGACTSRRRASASAHAVGLSRGTYVVHGRDVSVTRDPRARRRRVVRFAERPRRRRSCLERRRAVRRDGGRASSTRHRTGPRCSRSTRAPAGRHARRDRRGVRGRPAVRPPPRRARRVRCRGRRRRRRRLDRASTISIEVRAGGLLQRTTAATSPEGAPSDRPPSGGALARAASFVRMGVEHILTGYDHLLFLLGLVLASRGVRPLLAVVTAFTVGHSISLACVGARASGPARPPSSSR